MAAATSRYGKKGTFFMRPVTGEQVVFVLDTSGSMNSQVGQRTGRPTGIDLFIPRAAVTSRVTRLDLVKEQVVNALDGFEGERFHIVTFASDVESWHSRGSGAYPSLGAALAAARDHLAALGPGGGTNLHGGLRVAFRKDGVDEIFLLSDGQPSEGETDHDKILEAVKRWTKGRDAPALHCLAMGPPSPLLERMARASPRGSYSHVVLP